MLRKFLPLLSLIALAAGTAFAQDFTIEAPAGTELHQQLSASVDDKTTAHFFIFKGENDALSAIAVTVKNGTERKRKAFELEGRTVADIEGILLEDVDFDERPEAILFLRVNGELQVEAMEWLGTTIFTETETGAWGEHLAGSSDAAAVDRLKAHYTELRRQEKEDEVIGEALTGLIPDIKACSEKAIIKNGLQTVRVVIAFEVDEKGKVKKTGITDSNLGHKPSEKCSAKVVAGLDFKGQVKGPVKVEVPLEFSGSE